MRMKSMAIAALILLVISVGLGVWLGIAGAPYRRYNVALQTVHKLASVGFAVPLLRAVHAVSSGVLSLTRVRQLRNEKKRRNPCDTRRNRHFA